MKTLHVVALIIFLSVIGQAQSTPEAKPRRTMADATHAVKGPVKSFRTEIATFVLQDGKYVEGPRVVREEAWFNRDGARTNYHIYVNGVLARRIVMKFEGRKLLETINYSGTGQAYLRIVSTYDEAGQLKEKNTYHGDGSLRSTTTFKRNSQGHILEYTELSAQGILMEQMNYKREGEDVYSWERKLYDPPGTLRQEEIYVAPNKQTYIKYKSDGSVASRSVRVGDEMAEYGPDGSVQKATVIDRGDRLLDEMHIANEGSKTRVTQLPDEIDQHGNWTKQTKWFADPKGVRPLMVTYRALIYHEN